MTVGHPDWQTYASWRGAPLVSLQGTSIPGAGQNYGPFVIPHYAAVSLFFSSSSAVLVPQLTFYADAAFTQTVQVMEWCVPGGAKVTVSVPALSPYVGLSVTNFTGSAGLATIYLEPTNVAPAAPVYISQSVAVPLMYNTASVAAAGTLTITAAELFAGPVMVYVNTSTGNSFTAALNYYDPGLAQFRNIVKVGGASLVAGAQFQAAMPPSQCQLTLTNNDSVARTLVGAVIRAA